MCKNVVYHLLRASALIAALSIAAGCQDIISQNEGTTKGFYKCKEDGKKQGLQDYTVELFCISKNERPIDVKTSGGAVVSRRYNFDTHEPGAFYFSGNLINETNDKIITRFTIVFYRDKDKTYITKEFTNKFGEPKNQIYFEISEKDLALTEDDTKSPYQWSWNVSNIKGIKIEI